MNILITVTFAGSSFEPTDIFSLTALPSGIILAGTILVPPVTLTALQSGYLITNVPLDTTDIKIQSLNPPECTNNVTLTIPTTTTTTSTSTTTTTTTIPVYNVCASCDLYLTDVMPNRIGVLSVGELKSANSCGVIGNYLIDWYYGDTTGAVVFSSGNVSNPDPEIDQYQPFTGTEARPVIGGLWIPITRYVYIDGEKYTSEYTPGVRWSEDLGNDICLNAIQVDNLNCSNGEEGIYSHIFAYYNGKQVEGDRNKTIRFDLDANVNYFAWRFEGQEISDRLRIIHVSSTNTQTPLIDITVGYGDGPSDYTISNAPDKIAVPYTKNVIDLTSFTYASGDHLEIQITASHYQPTEQNTNWIFSCKCLDTFDCSWTPTIADNLINPPTMVLNSEQCRYEMKYYVQNYDLQQNTDIYKYRVQNPYGEGDVIHDPTDLEPYVISTFNAGDYCEYNGHENNTSSDKCIDSSQKTITKVGNILTIDFSSESEYLIWKSQWDFHLANNGPGFVNNPTDINYYRWMVVTTKEAAHCGDTVITRQMYVHWADIGLATFDPANYIITLTLQGTPITNQIVDPCPSCATLVYLNNANNAISAVVDFNITTNVRAEASFWSIYYTQQSIYETYSLSGQYYRIYPTGFQPDSCEIPAGWCENARTNHTTIDFYFYRMLGIITKQLPEGDPRENFEIWYLKDPVTGCEIPSHQQLFYKIENNVVVFPT